MVFLPVFGVYADGLLSALGIHPFIQLGGMYLCVQVSSAILTHITFYRMKIIIPMSYRYYTRVIRLGIFATVFVYVSSVMSVFTILFLAENQADAKAYLSVNLRPLPGVFWSDKFIVSSPLNGCAWLFLVSGAICVGFYVVLCITLPAICFAILYRSKDSLSAKIIKAQTDYLRTILLQVVAVILCVIMPLSVFFAATAYTYTNSMITVLSIMLSNFHGVTSTILHLFSNKPFRQTMKSQLSWIVCCLTCTRPKRKNTIHTMSSIVG
uniref:Uncharacterized protein n=1 Tax=Caenorhabditis japonica TaxID=281687 RepID=A0A8R1EAT6_CAEJA